MVEYMFSVYCNKKMFLHFLQIDLSITVVLSGDLYCKVVLVSVEKHKVQCERMH